MVGHFSTSSCVEVSFHAALRLGSHEQIAPSATFSGFQNAPLSSPSALPQPPHCPCNCCQYGPALLQVRQEASATEMHSNRFSFFFLTQTAATLHPICVCVCVCVCVRNC